MIAWGIAIALLVAPGFVVLHHYAGDAAAGLGGQRIVALDGSQRDDDSGSPALSADGRYLAVGVSNILVHDRKTGKTELVSVSSSGSRADDDSLSPALSADGRFVAFQSFASNLVPGFTDAVWNIFVHDRQTGNTELVSVSSDGSPVDDDSTSPSLSADGRYVAFQSFAANLVPGYADVSNIFVHDRQTGQTELVSVSSGGILGDDDSEAPAISADGRFVAFQSFASNLAPGSTSLVSNIFVHDRQSGETEVASVSSNGFPGDDDSTSPSLSADGRFVAFQSFASNLAPGSTSLVSNIFVHDRQSGQTKVVSVSSNGSLGDDDSETPAISADGRFVVFQSFASNLVRRGTGGISNIFVHDRQNARTVVVSVSSGGFSADDDSGSPAVSANGRLVAFQSFASNLAAPGDTHAVLDIFVVGNPLSQELGDADGDGKVTMADLRIVAAGLGTQPVSDLRADLNNDGHVDILDLVEVAMNLTK